MNEIEDRVVPRLDAEVFKRLEAARPEVSWLARIWPLGFPPAVAAAVDHRGGGCVPGPGDVAARDALPGLRAPRGVRAAAGAARGGRSGGCRWEPRCCRSGSVSAKARS